MASCKCCNVKVLIGTIVLFVILFIVALVLALKVFPDVLEDQVNKNVRLDTGTEQYDRFVEIPFPLDFKIYLFNLENPDGVKNGDKPNMTQVGPFVYKERRKKNIYYSDRDEDTITYTQQQTFEFDEAASDPLLENTTVTIINAPLMSMYQLAENFLMAGIAENCVTQVFPEGYRDIFITAPVEDLLFKGFNFCKQVKYDQCGLINSIFCADAARKRNVDILDDLSLRFSFFNFKERADDGVYTIKSGINDITTLGHITKWNGQRYTNYWVENSTCDEVKGTDSTLYPPRITEDDEFYIYSTDICRFVKIDFKSETTYKDIDGYMFGTSSSTLKPSTPKTEDDCYCIKKTADSDGKESCFLDGVIDMQNCFGVPVLFSFPHFLWASDSYLDKVIGLKPDENLHKIYLIVEPNTGIPLQGVKRIQLNMVVRPIAGIRSLLHMSRSVMPILWIEEGISLTDEWIDDLNSKYFDKVVLLDGVRWTLVAITAVLTLVFGGLLIWKRFVKKNR